jgi:hypothetical protein
VTWAVVASTARENSVTLRLLCGAPGYV